MRQPSGLPTQSQSFQKESGSDTMFLDPDFLRPNERTVPDALVSIGCDTRDGKSALCNVLAEPAKSPRNAPADLAKSLVASGALELPHARLHPTRDRASDHLRLTVLQQVVVILLSVPVRSHNAKRVAGRSLAILLFLTNATIRAGRLCLCPQAG